MKKVLAVVLATALSLCCLVGCGSNPEEGKENVTTPAPEVTTTAEPSPTEEPTPTEAPVQQEKKSDAAIMVVSFGTSYNDSRDITIGALEAAVEKAYPEYEVRRAFTSQIIIDVLKDRDNLVIDNVTEALDKAVADGIKELIVQPTHLMNGFEYNDLAVELTRYMDKFDKIVMAEPLLMSDGDFDAVVKAITEATASYDNGETAICFMGHGTEAPSNSVYATLQDKLVAAGYENYYIGTVEGAPTLEDVVAALKAKGTYKKVVLQPLMVVAGDHANNDMAGAEEDSWKTILEKEGYEVECILKGLGQMEAIQDVYVAHLKAAMDAGVAFEGVELPTEGGNVAELTDGTYSIDVESSSSMFKITKAELTIAGGEMTAVITLSGTGYGKLYLGTGEAAAAATEHIAFEEDADGAYTYTFPVAALDQPIDVAAFSNKKEEWYDRHITFLSATLKEQMEDGVYSIDVTLGGGSGRTTVVSPAKLTVSGGTMVATIEWTSPNYDYMLVNEEKFLPVNTEGNSVFEIPVAALDTELDVIGDTVAMSKPREIEYTLTFHSESKKSAE